ncbi:NAD-dependent epimerase/dehydratase family protein [Acetatifactor aquisgranensis]|uniref:NAD-dependent epimerase/dehydratase family protein n=1 Tax=Acetatifactor aquisgranensis TaxID=2941233 RepID=UPI00203C0058|nr:NAD-dependent epimerase/dehydratase family protein [Acetatifactor aquisgranensis]
MAKVLITGVAGFIGSKLSERFLQSGYQVEGWDFALETGAETNMKKMDMGDSAAVLEALKICRPDVIIHCAGCADVAQSVRFPEKDFHGNVVLTHNILFAMHQLHLENRMRFIFLSSAGVYGNPVRLPISEVKETNPLSPYALHKVMCEEMCMYFVKNYGMDIKIARIFSAYGNGLRKQIFWDMYDKFKKTGRLDMFGTGKESRDYIHVNDVIEALYLLSTVETDEIVFNVANGEEITIRQAAECFADCIGIEKRNIFFNGIFREGDPLNWKADISRMKALGYRKTTDMKSALEEYCEWVKGEWGQK